MTLYYMQIDPEDYDRYVALTDRSYSTLHARIADDLASLNQLAGHEPGLIIVVGCGTGAEVFPLFQKMLIGHMLCIDSSERMLGQLAHRLSVSPHEDLRSRCTLVHADFCADGWLERSIATLPDSWQRPTLRRTVISVYALHHLSAKDKLKVYRTIGGALSPSEWFINADLVSSAIPKYADLTQQREEDYILQSFALALRSTDGIAQRERMAELRDEWLSHVRTDNHPLPLVSVSDHDDSEFSLLLGAGFNCLDVTYRLDQTAVIWATKENLHDIS